MLTKDLILCKMANGRLKPQFVDTSDAELIDLAERLLAAYDPSNSPIREEIEELRWISFDELKSEMLEEPRKFSSWFMIAAPKVLKLISER